MYEYRNGLHLCGTLTLKEKCKYVHQISFAHNGIYIANTEHNGICYQNLIQKNSYSYTFGDTSVDINHPNSIFIIYDKILVLLHNKGRENSEIVWLAHDFENGFVRNYNYPYGTRDATIYTWMVKY
jgi:hypothetical protein